VRAHSPGRYPSVLLACLALGLWVACPSRAAAQSAWMPVKGEASVSAIFQSLNFGGHFGEGGEKLVGAVPSRAYLGIFQFEYGLSDKLAVTAKLPYIASKFTGHDHEPITALLRARYEEFRLANPGLEVSNLDTGDYYATFQDFNFTVRYNLLERGVVVTPVIGLTIPSHHYRTIGEAAPGQDRVALHTGVNVGRLLDPLLPNAYVHARYTYSFVQKLVGISLDRSNAEFEVGYALTPIVTVRALVDWLRTHGGVPFSQAFEDVFLFLAHDRLLASRYWHVGGAATISLSDAVDLDGAVVTFPAGSETHYGMGVSVGLTWRFLPAGAAQPSRITASRSRSILNRR
jgi:hypothetical protein